MLLVCPHEVEPWLYSWFSNDDVEGSMPLERVNKAESNFMSLCPEAWLPVNIMQ